MRIICFITYLFVCIWLLVGCTAETIKDSTIATTYPTPTTSGLFKSIGTPESDYSDIGENSVLSATVASVFGTKVIPTKILPAQPTLMPSQEPNLETHEIVTSMVYADRLGPGWRIITSEGMDVELTQSEYVLSGSNAIAITPREDYSAVLFTVRSTSEDVFLSDKVVAVSFWINGGSDQFDPGTFAVAVMGSNIHPYWSGDDLSVDLDEDGVNDFSETPLYFMGLDKVVPSNTWVEARLYIDDLVYDSPSEYMTGFYIKNDMLVRNTIYIDDISLLLIEENDG